MRNQPITSTNEPIIQTIADSLRTGQKLEIPEGMTSKQWFKLATIASQRTGIPFQVDHTSRNYSIMSR